MSSKKIHYNKYNYYYYYKTIYIKLIVYTSSKKIIIELMNNIVSMDNNIEFVLIKINSCKLRKVL
jgi:hypothetical protein